MKIFVGNLSYGATEGEVEDLFSQFGEVSKIRFINDRETGRFRGFCFIEMDDDNAANEAIDKLNETTFGGRQLRVNVASERETRERR